LWNSFKWQQPNGIPAIRLRQARHLPKSHKRDAMCASRCEGTQPRPKMSGKDPYIYFFSAISTLGTSAFAGCMATG
jgi:hypothetical protein